MKSDQDNLSTKSQQSESPSLSAAVSLEKHPLDELGEKACGWNSSIVATNQFTPRANIWSALDFLDGITSSSFTILPDRRESIADTMWSNICAEYDAENFCKKLEELNHSFPPEFLAFERAWRRDEFNHYLGFRRLYSLAFGLDEEEIHRKVIARPINFGPISEFLQDPFMICMIVAYDELATSKGYAEEVTEYRNMGPKQLESWIKLVAKDEANHFLNCIDVIKLCFSDRITEIPTILDKLIEISLSETEYGGTFVLDHQGDEYTPEFLERCKAIFLAHFRNAKV